MEPEVLHLAKYVVPGLALSLAKYTQMRFNALSGSNRFLCHKSQRTATEIIVFSGESGSSVKSINRNGGRRCNQPSLPTSGVVTIVNYFNYASVSRGSGSAGRDSHPAIRPGDKGNAF